MHLFYLVDEEILNDHSEIVEDEMPIDVSIFLVEDFSH